VSGELLHEHKQLAVLTDGVSAGSPAFLKQYAAWADDATGVFMQGALLHRT
jgi:hypothetical protein